MNPIKTAYMIHYRDSSGSGYQWSGQTLTHEPGKESVDAGAAVERRVLAIPADRAYITVESDQNTESYTAGLRQKYITVLVLAGSYVPLYVAAWCVLTFRKKEREVGMNNETKNFNEGGACPVTSALDWFSDGLCGNAEGKYARYN